MATRVPGLVKGRDMATQSGIRAGNAFVELFTRDSRLERGLRAAQRKVQVWAQTVNRAGLGAIAFAAGLAAPFLLAVNAASELEETMNKFNVVFGDQAAAVKAWGDDFSKQVGRSKEQIASFLASTQDLLVPVGLDPTAAEAMSKQLTALAVDVASFNNKTDADVLRDFHAALTGGGETVKKYGVLLNVATTNAELLAMGLDPKTATDQQKVVARMNILLKATTAAQGDAVRSANSYANQLKRLQGEAKNAAASIGGALLPVLVPILQKASAAAEAIALFAEKNPELTKTLFAVVAGIGALGVALVVFGAIASGVSSIIGLFVTVLGILKAAIGILLSPIGLVIAGLTGLAAWFATSTDAGREMVASLKSGFAGLKADAMDAFGGIKDAMATGDIRLAWQILVAFLQLQWRKFVVYLNTEWASFVDFFFAAIDGVKAAWTAVKETFIGVGIILKQAWTSVVSFITEIWNGLLSVLESGWNKFANFINRQLDKLPKQIDPGFRVQTLNVGGAKVDTSGGDGGPAETPAQRTRRLKSEADLKKAQEEFRALLAKASKQRADQEAAAAKKKPPAVQPAAVQSAAAAAVESAQKTLGTFSATVANRSAFDAVRVPREQLKVAKQSAELLGQIQQDIRANVLVWEK